ncbi:MAG TPA: transposase [Bacillota bacterium]|nr:transposase [Bacillota bacterium]
MARVARVVIPNIPHHIVQRGNRRQTTFFCDDDYIAYLELMRQWSSMCNVAIWAYCLMPNHVHLIAVPASEDGLRRAIGETHRRYTRRINFRERWRGHLWQYRFASYPMDETYLLMAARYIELNPVRAGLVSQAEDYRWSSAAAHVLKRPDLFIQPCPIFEDAVADWRQFLSEGVEESAQKLLERHEHTGRPLGDESFLVRLEKLLNRSLQKQRPGPKVKGN